MNSRLLLGAILWLSILAPAAADADTRHRYLLAVGANAGGHGRQDLKYAVSDAERFADIMVRMGGVAPADRVLLDQPDRPALESALARIAARIAADPQRERSEILFYYSGHADGTGLLLGGTHLAYGDLRAWMEAVPSAVRITLLDACASGVITRMKGGEIRQPFLVDVSAATEGYAFLTSSSDTEAAQESDAIGASFFTHFLVSGLRGAADVSGDGRISLTEAYQFAFNETLARTTDTMGGAQHPSYHINLSGTGDVVMTDVRQTSAGLVLGKDLDGRFFIRDGAGNLVAELNKPRGRSITLGLEAGAYTVHLDQPPALFRSEIRLDLDENLVLGPEHFEAADRQPTIVRGDRGAWPPRPGFMGPLVGASQLRLTIGRHDLGLSGGDDPAGQVSVSAGSENLLLGLGYSRWIREHLALVLDLLVVQGEARVDVGATTSTQARGLVAVRLGARRYLPRSTFGGPIRPYVALGCGALVGSEEKVEAGIPGTGVSAKSMGAFGAEFGLGLDVVLGRRVMVGARAAYDLVTDFPEPLAGRRNYSSLEFGVSLGWLFGRNFDR